MKILSTIFAMMIAVSPVAQAAETYIEVPDASQLQYIIQGTGFYFRNLNQFNSAMQGCCYYYYFDVNGTPQGKAWLALILSRAALKQNIFLGFSSIKNTANTPIVPDMIGNL